MHWVAAAKNESMLFITHVLLTGHKIFCRGPAEYSPRAAADLAGEAAVAVVLRVVVRRHCRPEEGVPRREVREPVEIEGTKSQRA
jgi:hypothetical protein